MVRFPAVMRRIRNRNLEQLLMQLRFTPEKKRRQQLEGAEKLLAIIEDGTSYPFEFVCYHVTGIHLKNLPDLPLIKGDELADDLQIFLGKLSGQLAQAVDEAGERVYGIDELAKEFGVSTKTIGRWRKRGLKARKFVFDDAKKRFGFRQGWVEAFIGDNPEIVARAKKFSRLTKEAKQQIIKKASALAKGGGLSRYQIISKVAGEMGKAHETVRYTILNYEKKNPTKRVFNKPFGVIAPGEAAELYRLYEQGCGVKELMEQFSRSKSSVYRIINRRRAKSLLGRKIEFVDSDEFLEEGAMENILGRKGKWKATDDGTGTAAWEVSGGSLAGYLQTLKEAATLNRDEEAELFRRYNYLKYLVCITRAGMKPTKVLSGRLRKTERYLAQAEAIQETIIESNLRLVVSIASKHTSGGANLLELISDGNVSLIRAVEKFDYTGGFRFATYTSWAITKDFARKLPAEARHFDKVTGASMSDIDRDLRITEAADFGAIERARQSLVQVIRDDLSEREQYVILNHFGLIGSLVKKQRKTLKDIGKNLELSKERVRQIELLALQKLRQSLSIEEFELLTG